jgi:hypothetical protein
LNGEEDQQKELRIAVNISASKGTVMFYLKAGNEVWGKSDLWVQMEEEVRGFGAEMKLAGWGGEVGREGNEAKFMNRGLRHASVT